MQTLTAEKKEALPLRQVRKILFSQTSEALNDIAFKTNVPQVGKK